MTGAADWPTIIAFAIVAVVAWTGGFWFSSQIRTSSSEVERRLQAEIIALKLEITELRALKARVST